MNKADFIDDLTKRLGDKKVATAALDAFIDVVERSLARGEKVSITGFGTFETSDRAGRQGRNPQTGESVRIKKSTVAKFRPGARLKGVANKTVKLGREPKHEPLLPAGVTTIVKRAETASAAATPAPAKKAAAKKTAPAKKAPAAKKVAAPVKAAAKKSAAKAAPAKKAAAKKTAPVKAAAKKTAPKAAAPAKKTTA